MKLRLNLKNKEFLCKEISAIKINDVLYHKKDYKTSVDIQKFYFLMIKNIKDIQYIKERKSNNEYFYKNQLLHNIFGPAFVTNSYFNNRGYYYLNGELFKKKDWEDSTERKNYIRNLKLKNIINENI